MGKVNFKLINICILTLTIFLLYQTSGLWIYLVHILGKMFIPFILAFMASYSINPIIRYLKKIGIPKLVSIFSFIIFLILILIIIVTKLLPSLFNELSSILSGIIIFITSFSQKYNLNIDNLKETLLTTFNFVISNFGKILSGGVINFVNIIINYFSTFVIFFTATIYFLIDMDTIRDKVFKILNKKSEKLSNLLENIDSEMVKYFSSFFKIMIITFFEYGLGFLIVGHPNFLLLGFLASLASFIPCFGGIFVNCIAAITAYVINFKLFIRTIILFCILSFIDGNVINPLVYGKTNKIHPLITIFAMFVGGIIFKLLGIIISIPITVIILTTYRFYKK